MTWIETVDEENAEGSVKESYEAYKRIARYDRVAEILKAFSLNPAAFDAHYAFYRVLMFDKGPLQRYQREMIATRVSSVNACHY